MLIRVVCGSEENQEVKKIRKNVIIRYNISTFHVIVYNYFRGSLEREILCFGVADPRHINAEPHHFNADPDPAFHINADPDLAFHFNSDPESDPAPHQSHGILRPLVFSPFRTPF
jgi:hypothetical protein